MKAGFQEVGTQMKRIEQKLTDLNPASNSLKTARFSPTNGYGKTTAKEEDREEALTRENRETLTTREGP